MKISVKVITNSKEEKIEETETGFKVWIRPKPVDNEANLALVETVARYFDVRRGNVKIISGFKSRNKIIEISDGSKNKNL